MSSRVERREREREKGEKGKGTNQRRQLEPVGLEGPLEDQL